MTLADIANNRLINQQLAGAKLTTPQQIAGCMGAMQAQDYAMAKWAIGVRLPVTEKQIDNALQNGDIYRTHILRPTWHFISAHDIHWMLALTGPHIKTAMSSVCRKLGLDSKALHRCNSIIERSLSGNKHQTREELMRQLNEKGIITGDISPALIMMNAELDGIVGNGYMREKQFTYSLLEKRHGAVSHSTRAESLAALALRYFTSHGPATLKDFAWWSGLPVTGAKTGLESVKAQLFSEKTGDDVYWFAAPAGHVPKATGQVYLLPAFDEYTVSYKDRSAAIGPAVVKQAITGNGIFKPMIIVNGKVEGIWKRTVKKDEVIIETHFLKEVSKAKKKLLGKAVERYGEFLERKVIVKETFNERI